MEYNYEFIFFEYLYKKIGLQKYDEELLNKGIKMIDPENADKRISKYFSLLSKGDTLNFSQELKDRYSRIFNKDLNEILTNNYDEAIEFINETYKEYFHLNDPLEYKYYGPADEDYLAPSNCIVIGLNYSKYNIERNNVEEEIIREDGIVVDMLNLLQGPVAQQSGYPLAAVSYNEVTLSQPFVRL